VSDSTLFTGTGANHNDGGMVNGPLISTEGDQVIAPLPAVASGTVVNPMVHDWGLYSVDGNLLHSIDGAILVALPDEEEPVNIVITPLPAVSRGETVNPAVMEGGNIYFTPAPAFASASTVNPAVELSSLILLPDPAIASARALVGSIIEGSITITPVPAVAVGDVSAPGVILGDITIVPVVAIAEGTSVNPDVLVDNKVIVTPLPASSIGTVAGPQIVITTVIKRQEYTMVSKVGMEPLEYPSQVCMLKEEESIMLMEYLLKPKSCVIYYSLDPEGLLYFTEVDNEL